MANLDFPTNAGRDDVRDELLELIDQLASTVTQLLWSLAFNDENAMWASPEAELLRKADALVKQCKGVP